MSNIVESKQYCVIKDCKCVLADESTALGGCPYGDRILCNFSNFSSSSIDIEEEK